MDIEIKSRLQALKENKSFDSNNGFPLPPPNNRPPSPPPPPTSFFSSSHIGIPHAPTAPPFFPIPKAPLFSPTIPTVPPLSPPRVFSFRPISSDENATNATRFGEVVAAKSEQERTRENDDILDDAPSPPNLELSDEILNVLSYAENEIKTDYASDKTLNEKGTEDIKKNMILKILKIRSMKAIFPLFLIFSMEAKVKNFALIAKC